MAEPVFHDGSEKAIEVISRQQLMPLADAIARIVRNEIVEGMDPGPPRTGATYLVPGTQTSYTASAPGEPPAVREGIYRDGWETTPPVDDGKWVRAHVVNHVHVGANGEYLLGRLLEEGTNDLVNYGVRMQPRPHIRPALVRARPKVRALIARFRGVRLEGFK